MEYNISIIILLLIYLTNCKTASKPLKLSLKLELPTVKEHVKFLQILGSSVLLPPILELRKPENRFAVDDDVRYKELDQNVPVTSKHIDNDSVTKEESVLRDVTLDASDDIFTEFSTTEETFTETTDIWTTTEENELTNRISLSGHALASALG